LFGGGIGIGIILLIKWQFIINYCTQLQSASAAGPLEILFYGRPAQMCYINN